MKHLPDLPTLRHRCPLFHSSVRSSVRLSVNSSVMSKFDIYVEVSILINYNSTTTIIPCMTHLPDLLTWQVCWPSDLDLYFALHWLWHIPASVAQLDAPSDWRPGGRGFNPRRGRQHSFVEIDHEIFSTVILSLPLIQEGQLSVSGERMCTILVIRLED